MMGLSAQKRAYYEEHIQAWRHSGLSQEKYCEQANIAYGSFKSWPSKLKQNETVKTEFVEAKVPEPQDVGAILQISLPNGVRIGISSPKSNALVEQVLKFVGQLP
jgi:hypothetical protein